MDETDELKRLEFQLYEYQPELKRDSEDVKLKRRNSLFTQLHSSSPQVKLFPLDPVSALTNIKQLLEKCKDVVNNHYDETNYSGSEVVSPALSLIESSGDEYFGTQRPRRAAARKRRATSTVFRNTDIVESRNDERQKDAPLSLSILIPQVVKGADKMEISIDLGDLDASQRIFGSRVDGLLRNSSNSNHMLDDVPHRERENSTNRENRHLRAGIATSTNTIETTNESNERQEDEMLSHLISQVLVENHDSETMQATNVLDAINNNESRNYDVYKSDFIGTSKEQTSKKKRQRKGKKSGDQSPPKKRGRKPKAKLEKQSCSENTELPKSDLAKYVELFSNTCNMAGSATPAASSTLSQQLVTSTTHYLDSTEQQPITYYLEGDWANGGSCQLVQTENPQIDGGQDEFSMAELVNYIDNVGDPGNVIARVLEGPSTIPVLVQETQTQNTLAPPPAHVSDILLDLSKKSTINFQTNEPREIRFATTEIIVDIMPLDLSIKSNKSNESSTFNTSLVHSVSVEPPGMLIDAAEVIPSSDCTSFGAALDMPLIDIDDNINAFMQLTNSEVITTATITAPTVTECALPIAENAKSTSPICDFEINEILAENNICQNQESTPVSQNTLTNTSTSIDNIYARTDNTKSVKRSEVNFNEKCFGAVNFRQDSVGRVNINQESFGELNRSLESVGVLNLSQESVGILNLNQENVETECKLSKENSKLNPKSFDLHSISSEDKIEKQPPTHFPGHIDELHSDSSDLLFVDTELLASKLKFNYNGPSSNSNLDTPQEYSNKTDGKSAINGKENENTECHDDSDGNLSSKNDLSKSIDLIEENQEHNVSVKLPMPELISVKPNSEEFAFDFETGFESNEECSEIQQQQSDHQNALNALNTNDESVNFKISFSLSENDSGIENSLVISNACDKIETLTREIKTLVESEEIYTTCGDGFQQNRGNEVHCEETRPESYTHENKRETVRKQPSNLEDSAICCKQEDSNSYNELESESQNLNQSECEENEIRNISPKMCSKAFQHLDAEKLIVSSTQHNSSLRNQKPDNLSVKKSATIQNLSVLEMESKLDEDCLDFEDTLEDDVLSLATSCFNSDDERPTEVERSTTEFPPLDQKDNICCKTLNSEITGGDENTVKIKVEDTRETTQVSSQTFKEFKIPKISLTTATAKHGNGNITAAALPMVILPTNAFNKQTIKTEPDFPKPVNLEKITRTVQNVCAVTPLTLQQPTFQITPVTIKQQTPLDTVTPVFRPMLHLAAPKLEENINNFKIANIQQDTCVRGEYAGNGGDGINYGPPTILIAKTFGVTCLPFLVGRCLTTPTCKFSHLFREPATVRGVLMNLSEPNLSIAYKFAYNHEIVYRKYVHEFCRVYAERNNRVKLLHMVSDCERYKDGGEVFAAIYQALQYCGLNKVNACRQILNYSRDKSRSTIDALLAIILEADWTMFADQIEKFSDISTYSFRVNVLHQMASSILNANDQRMTSLFFKCLVNLDPHDVGLVQSSPILMQLLELIKNGQICR